MVPRLLRKLKIRLSWSKNKPSIHTLVDTRRRLVWDERVYRPPALSVSGKQKYLEPLKVGRRSAGFGCMLYLLTSTFIIGILLGSLIPIVLPTTALLFVSVGLFTIVLLFRREPIVVKLGTCVLLLVFGAWRYQSVQPSDRAAWVQSLNDGPELTLTGQVVGDPERVGDIQRLEVGRLRLKGKLLVRAPLYPEYSYGDGVEVTGKLETPPEFEDFSYRDYLATRGIYSLANFAKVKPLSSGNGNRTYALLLNFRHRLEEKISQILPEPESSLLAGVVLGVKRNLPEDFYEALQKSGTLHVVVVSGTNITYVIAFLAAASGLLARPLRMALTIFGISAYALMVGGGAAVWRAALMGLVTLMALVFGRRRLAQEALFLSAAVLLLANPMGLWQVGFQLSFAATSGIIFLQDLIDQWLQALPHLIRKGLVTTLAAQIAVLPIISSSFQTLSLVSPFSNLLIFSLVPVITISGALVALMALVWLPLGQLVAPLVYLPAKLFVTIVKISAKVPFAQIEIPQLSIFVWLVYYLVLVYIVIRCRKEI